MAPFKESQQEIKGPRKLTEEEIKGTFGEDKSLEVGLTDIEMAGYDHGHGQSQADIEIIDCEVEDSDDARVYKGSGRVKSIHETSCAHCEQEGGDVPGISVFDSKILTIGDTVQFEYNDTNNWDRAADGNPAYITKVLSQKREGEK